MKKIRNAMPSQVRTFLTMVAFSSGCGCRSAAAPLTVSAPSLGVNNVAEKTMAFVQLRSDLTSLTLQIRRRRSVHELGRHPVRQVVQDDMLGQEVARACRPRYRIEPDSFGLGHVRASIFRGLDAPQWSGMSTGADLRMRSGVTGTVRQSLGDQIPRVDAGDPGEARAESDARLLRDEHQVGRAAAQRLRAAAGQRGRPYARTIVPGPTDPGHGPARRERPRTPQRHVLDRGRRLAQHHLDDVGADVLGGVERRHVATVVTAPLRVHQIRRPDLGTASGATHRDTHSSKVRVGRVPVKRIGRTRAQPANSSPREGDDHPFPGRPYGHVTPLRGGLPYTRPYAFVPARPGLGPAPVQVYAGGGSAWARIHACMAMPLATPALIERVDPYWAIEKSALQAARAGSESPGPS